MQFVINNWYLFLALFVVLGMLIGPVLRQRLSGVKNLSPAEAIRVINREAGVVVDVREPPEFASGHIPSAINVPMATLANPSKSLQKHKARPLVVACRSGNRSLAAAVTLRKQGFGTVYSLAGGISAWQRDNLPLEK